MSKPSAIEERSAPSPLSPPALRSLVRTLSVVEDPRSARGIRHPLINILSIAVLGCMCGCDDAEALEDWANKERNWLGEFLEMPHGVPSQDVFLRVLAAIRPSSFRAAFGEWMQEVLGAMGVRGQIAIDGQTHRRSGDKAKSQSPVHMVHALACDVGLVLGQLATEAKSNEITAIPELLNVLDLDGALVSIDAMGTQTKIASQIVEAGGDYLLQVKDNQPTLRAEIEAAFVEASDPRARTIDEFPPPTLATHTTVDGGHGRIETRTAQVLSNLGDWVPTGTRWAGLHTVVVIKATREDSNTGEASEEIRYYISSRNLSPEEGNRTVRNHWLIENQLHWCLDMTFGQDACRTRTGNAAENLGLVRHFALNLIRRYDGDRYSVPRRRRLCDYDRGYRDRLLRASDVS